ncbi:MAG TPA: hypothetical protein VN442_00880 [Bryobacteraceae bacterium]|nr:hypothetical protein [Bryobacteraceae bacterium]
MSHTAKQTLVLIAGVAVLFIVIAVMVLRIMPAPHMPADYLIAGSLATLVSLVLLFAVLFGLSSNTFRKRR